MFKKNGIFKIAIVDVQKNKEVAGLLNCEETLGLFMIYRGRPVWEHLGKPEKDTLNEFYRMAKFYD